MNYTEKSGKTIDEAVKLALEELKVSREKVEIEVLVEPSRGIFGLIGTKDAKVRVTRVTIVDSPEELAVNFLKDVLKNIGLEAQYKTTIIDETLNIEVIGKDMGVLIGRRGQTLDAFQYLVSLVVNKNRENYLRVLLDTEDYRKKREQTLVRLANKLAYKVRKTGKEIVLEPMNPYERRIIHSALQGNPGINTKSQGEEPFRRVLIAAK